MESKLRIAYLTKDMAVNGITAVIMNYCRHLDRDRYQLTVLAGSPITETYRTECEKLGVQLIELPPKKSAPKAYYRAIWKHLSARAFDVVHIHGNSATITVELAIAAWKGIGVRIAHSHNTTCDNEKLHKLLSPLFRLLCTHRIACGEEAGKWMFGRKPFVSLPNGIDNARFAFDPNKRAEVRRELGVEGYLIGHIGRFNDQKNHPFLLSVFEKAAAVLPNAYLLLVGDGPNYDKVTAMIETHPYKSRIICYGTTDRMDAVYSAIDVFVLPSLFEGLPVALIEAQSAGLDCVVSDRVTGEADLTNSVAFLPIDDAAGWAEKLSALSTTHTEVDRERCSAERRDRITRAGYDAAVNARMLSSIYDDAVGGRR